MIHNIVIGGAAGLGMETMASILEKILQRKWFEIFVIWITRPESEAAIAKAMEWDEKMGGFTMNIFDFALKMELDGEKYYRELAAQAKYQELKVVLEGLADDEQRHYNSNLAADPAVSNARNGFEPGMNKTFIPKDKDSIEKLVHEEEKQAEVLGNIIQILNHANEWVESAEFNHNKPY